MWKGYRKEVDTDFNNLVMQTLWWLPIKILRHIHKKRFSVFLSRFLRICNQSVQKVLIRAKTFFFLINMGIKKRRISRWFRIRWKSFEKMHPKKVISKNVTEICTFFTFTHVRQTCFACTFFLVHLFTIFSTDSISAWHSAFSDSFFDLFQKKNFLGHISTFCKLWSQMRKKRLKKSKKRIL